MTPHPNCWGVRALIFNRVACRQDERKGDTKLRNGGNSAAGMQHVMCWAVPTGAIDGGQKMLTEPHYDSATLAGHIFY